MKSKLTFLILITAITASSFIEFGLTLTIIGLSIVYYLAEIAEKGR